MSVDAAGSDWRVTAPGHTQQRSRALGSLKHARNLPVERAVQNSVYRRLQLEASDALLPSTSLYHSQPSSSHITARQIHTKTPTNMRQHTDGAETGETGLNVHGVAHSERSTRDHRLQH